ncbi:MAG: YfhO family protein, partial [Erysipelotrichaceae bacterium]|nr:YfhO family protein [Erysipelotrichaceae bacterium]
PISNCNLYFDIGNLSNVKIELFYQDQILYAESFFQYNYIELYIPEDMKVDRFIVSGNEEEPVEVFAYIEDMRKYDEIFEERYQERFENVVVKNNHIEADITMKSDGYAFTQVPYDVGWDVYVDGHKVTTEKVQLGFVGFKLDKGNHHVEMKYHIPYLGIGASISAISCILLVVLSRKRAS